MAAVERPDHGGGCRRSCGAPLRSGLFAGLWELFWVFGWADPKLLPPPHIFLGIIADQAKFFNTATAGRSAPGRAAATARRWR